MMDLDVRAELVVGITELNFMEIGPALKSRRSKRSLVHNLAQKFEARPLGEKEKLVRESFTLPKDQAGQIAMDWMKLFPASSYWSRVESWKRLQDGRINFTMVRLPSAD